MEIQVRIAVTESFLAPKISAVTELSKDLNRVFLSKNYSDDVSMLSISIIAVLERPGYEDWYKERKLKYIAFKVVKSKLTGEEYVVEKTISYEIKLTQEQISNFLQGTINDSKKALITILYESFERLNNIPKYLKSFDKERFKADFKTLTEELHLI